MEEEVPSVNMTNSFHQWVAGKTNCDVFDVSCETDRDCSAACETLFSEDGEEITKFICDKVKLSQEMNEINESLLEKIGDLKEIV